MSDSVIYTNAENFEEDVLNSSLPVVVYFYSEDCGPCEAFDPMFKRMAEAYSKDIKFVKVLQTENVKLVEKYNIRITPTLLFFSGGKEVCSRLSGYISKPELKDVLENILGGRCPKKIRGKVNCDVLILGGGPAGLTAAIYTSRAKLFTVVVEEGLPGGQVSTTYHVANYPGTNGVVKGIDLMENMKNQAVEFGARIDDMKDVTEVELKGDLKHVKAEDTDYYAKSMIIATGAQPRKLPAQGEKEFRGRGVHYCATCDGALYHDADLLVIGGGNSAVEEAVTLTNFAKHVTIVHQFDHFQATKTAQKEALNNPKISVIWDSEVRKIKGDDFVKGAVIENLKTGETKEIKVDGIFVYIGMEPKTKLFTEELEIDDRGYIVTDDNMLTSVKGVFAAGDVRNKEVRQIANAVGDGAVAAVMAEKYLNTQ